MAGILIGNPKRKGDGTYTISVTREDGSVEYVDAEDLAKAQATFKGLEKALSILVSCEGEIVNPPKKVWGPLKKKWSNGTIGWQVVVEYEGGRRVAKSRKKESDALALVEDYNKEISEFSDSLPEGVQTFTPTPENYRNEIAKATTDMLNNPSDRYIQGRIRSLCEASKADVTLRDMAGLHRDMEAIDALIAELQGEISRLRAENQKLRGLHGQDIAIAAIDGEAN